MLNASKLIAHFSRSLNAWQISLRILSRPIMKWPYFCFHNIFYKVNEFRTQRNITFTIRGRIHTGQFSVRILWMREVVELSIAGSTSFPPRCMFTHLNLNRLNFIIEGTNVFKCRYDMIRYIYDMIRYIFVYTICTIRLEHLSIYIQSIYIFVNFIFCQFTYWS